MGSLIHGPVNAQEEKERGKQAVLFHPSEHCECFLCLSLVEHLALHVLVCVLDDVYVFGGDSVVCH